MKTKTIFIVGLAAAAIGLVGCQVAGCGTTRICKMPYSQAEGILFKRLSLDKDTTLTNPVRVQAKAEGDLANLMSMQLYAVVLNEHTPGTSLSLLCHHLYDIGADGGEYIRFDLRTQGAGKTRITVDYCDRWWGMWPPFVFWNPGPFRERDIHHLIWEN